MFFFSSVAAVSLCLYAAQPCAMRECACVCVMFVAYKVKLCEALQQNDTGITNMRSTIHRQRLDSNKCSIFFINEKILSEYVG